jgi:hypothetical protein
LIIKNLQNGAGVLFLVNPVRFIVFRLDKRANQCFLAFYRTKPVGRSRRYFTEFFEVNVSACFLLSCSGILPILASEKEKIIDY